MQPKLSVIIPTYNTEKTIKECLHAIYSSNFKDFEVIVVDDESTDNTINIVKKFPCNIVKLEKNSGPARARNIGAQKAKSDLLFFVDSDIILKENSLSETYNQYSDKNTHVVIGMYAKEAANKGFFQNYMALWKYHTWIHPKPPKYFSFFIASCGSIKKDVFFEFGGFNAKYRGADVEDYELGYRIREKYKIHFNSDIQGKHYHPYFGQCAKNYHKRASQWFSLFLKRKSFDKGAASASRGISSLVGFSILVLILGMIKFPQFWPLLTLATIVFVSMNLSFYIFTLKEKGFWFMIKAFFTNLTLSVIISAGVLRSIVSYCLSKKP